MNNLENNKIVNTNLKKKAGAILLAGCSSIALINANNILLHDNQKDGIISSIQSPDYGETLNEKTYDDIINLTRKVWEDRTTVINPSYDVIANLKRINVDYSLTTLEDGSIKLSIPFDENKPVTAPFEKYIEKNVNGDTITYELCYRLPKNYSMCKVDSTKHFPGVIAIKEEPESESYVLYATLNEYKNQDVANIDIDSVEYFESGIPVYKPYTYVLQLKDIILYKNASKLTPLDSNPYLFAVPKDCMLYSLDGSTGAYQVGAREDSNIYMFIDDVNLNNVFIVKKADYDTLMVIDKLGEIIRDEYYEKTNSFSK